MRVACRRKLSDAPAICAVDEKAIPNKTTLQSGLIKLMRLIYTSFHINIYPTRRAQTAKIMVLR